MPIGHQFSHRPAEVVPTIHVCYRTRGGFTIWLEWSHRDSFVNASGMQWDERGNVKPPRGDPDPLDLMELVDRR